MPFPMSRRAVAGCAAVVAALTAVPAAGAVPAAAAPSAPATAPAPDFNGDGHADLVINSPDAAVDGVPRAGNVAIVYGAFYGGDMEHARNLNRNQAWIPGEPTEGDAFGETTAAGDLNGDGYDDLAVGGRAGSPVIIWGSAGGLGEDTSPLSEEVYELAGGDVNGDGRDDLVVRGGEGVQVRLGPFSAAGRPASVQTVEFGPAENVTHLTVGDMNGDGRADVIASLRFEETVFKSRWFAGTSRGISTTPRSTGAFTSVGVVADVDRDGYGDFVARDLIDAFEGAEYEAGAIRVVYGSASGPSTRTKRITQNTAGVPGVSEAGREGTRDLGDQFGYALAAGDVTGDGYPDIAVGVPGEDLGAGGAKKQAGAVVLLKGGRSGLTGTGAQAVHQSTKHVPGASENDDHFGAAVTLSDVTADGRADLAAAAPLEDNAYQDSGAVWPFLGAKEGLVTTNITIITPAKIWSPQDRARFGEGFAR